MIYPEAKVYCDGSHYIAIPHTEKKNRPKKRIVDEFVDVIEPENSDEVNNEEINEQKSENTQITEIKKILKESSIKKSTKRDLFNNFYKEAQSLSKNKRKNFLIRMMRPYFDNRDETKSYVELNIQRKIRNMITRKVRLWRKINLQKFNYFCTFTYDSHLMDEVTFKKKLQTVLRNNVFRKGWKYIGIWERSPEKNRLHFHGLFSIPEGMIGGTFEKVRDYSTAQNKMQEVNENSFFRDKFGRNDFKPISSPQDMNSTVGYLLKYIEKTGEKLVYSKGLPPYFISDIMEEDVACKIGVDDRKLLLFDDFTCWDEGEYIGKVSPDVIKQLRKSNS